MKKTLFFLLILVLTFSFFQLKDKTLLSKVMINDDYDFISINNIKFWVSNNGNESHDPETDGSGFYWPKDSTVILPWSGIEGVPALIFEDGLVWGGRLLNADTFKIRVGGSTSISGILTNGRWKMEPPGWMSIMMVFLPGVSISQNMSVMKRFGLSLMILIQTAHIFSTVHLQLE